MAISVRKDPRPAIVVLHELMVEGLSPQQREVRDLIVSGQAVTNPGLQIALGAAPNHVGNILSRLHSLGLLERVRDETVYVYKEALWHELPKPLT